MMRGRLSRASAPFLVGGCHAIDALRWFAATGEFEAATPVEVFAVAGGRRKGSVPRVQPAVEHLDRDAPPMEYDGLEMALVKFDNGVVGKVSVNAECIMPYRFPLRIFGDLGSVFDNRIWSHKYPGQTDWVELPTILPDSSNVAHHPFQAEIDHFVDCLRSGRPSHCRTTRSRRMRSSLRRSVRARRTGRSAAAARVGRGVCPSAIYRSVKAPCISIPPLPDRGPARYNGRIPAIPSS